MQFAISRPTGTPGDRTNPYVFLAQIASPRFPGRRDSVPREREPPGDLRNSRESHLAYIYTRYAIPWGSSEFQKITKSNTFACFRVCKMVISCPTGAPGDRTKPKEFVAQIAFPRFPGTSVCVPREGKTVVFWKIQEIECGLCIFLPNEIS